MYGHGSNDRSTGKATEETSLLGSHRSEVSRPCFPIVFAGLAVTWCVLDCWNHQLTGRLFQGQGQNLEVIVDKFGEIQGVESVEQAPFFKYALTLAFLQFAFMALCFSGLWFALSSNREADMRNMLNAASDKRFPLCAVTHMFSTFWLQALAMPMQVFSLEAYAFSRSIEIPASAGLRSYVLSSQLGRKGWSTPMLMAGAACTLVYATTKMAGCVCIWSGYGVPLTGISFVIVYGLLLLLPATHRVCQEVVMFELGVSPLALLAAENIFATAAFLPLLIGAHILGFEDVVGATDALQNSTVFMIVIWLCLQMALIAGVTVAIIAVADSFWAVAVRSSRALYWTMSTFLRFAIYSKFPLAVACPYSGFWGMVICGGAALFAAALHFDQNVGRSNISQISGKDEADFSKA